MAEGSTAAAHRRALRGWGAEVGSWLHGRCIMDERKQRAQLAAPMAFAPPSEPIDIDDLSGHLIEKLGRQKSFN
jgi:hypothetical protein